MSTSNNRNILSDNSIDGIMYESNSKGFKEEAQKSEYSYLQYHWWATTLTEKVESIDSSSIYKSSKEGIAIWISTIAGIIVQTPSIICLSNKFLVINIFIVDLTIQYPTNEIIKTRIIQIKSCKKN